MSRRMLISILVIIGLCWLALASLGLAGGLPLAGRLDLTAPNFQQLRGCFAIRLPVSHMRLEQGDPAACELNATRLAAPAGGMCVYAIQPDRTRTRRLSLTLTSKGRLVRLVLVQPGALTVEKILTTGASIDLEVYPNDQNQGAELTIKDCVAILPAFESEAGPLAQCVLELKK